MPGAADKSPSLAKMQAEFAAKLGAQGDGVPGGIVGAGEGVSRKRFDVYRNNAGVMLMEALRRRYRVIERLVGEEFFNAAAYRFIAAHPPRSPALFEFGDGFADFLDGFEPARSLPYLSDVARLEWLRHTAYHAADAEPMQAAALGRIPPDQAGDTVLELHPSAGLVISEYPVVSIWETNVADAAVRKIGPDMAGEAALIVRPRLEVKVVRLGPGGGTFVSGIGQGDRLAVAAERAGDAAPAFSLAETLGAALAAGAFAGFSICSVLG